VPDEQAAETGSIVREGTLTAIILITLLGLAAGHLLGG
jgi:hypothetical protein